MNLRFHRYWGMVGILLAWLTLLGWAPPARAAQAAIRIGIVDVQEVLNKSQKGLAVKQKLDQERAVRQKDLDARQDEVMKLQAEFERQAPVLSEQAKREKSETIQRKRRDTLRMAEDANRDFEKRVREAEMDITREILSVIQEYGKDQGYTVVLERGSVLFGAPAVDITGEVIKRYDAKQK